MKFGTQNKSSMSTMNIVLGRSWLKILDSGKFGSNTEICSDFYEIWHSHQIEHANHEYNTRQCLKRLRDYWLRMIIGWKIQLIVRTWLIFLRPR